MRDGVILEHRRQHFLSSSVLLHAATEQRTAAYVQQPGRLLASAHDDMEKADIKERIEKIEGAEHLVRDDAQMNMMAHEQHPDTLKECLSHDLPQPDDRGCAKCCDPPKHE